MLAHRALHAHADVPTSVCLLYAWRSFSMDSTAPRIIRRLWLRRPEDAAERLQKMALPADLVDRATIPTSCLGDASNGWNLGIDPGFARTAGSEAEETRAVNGAIGIGDVQVQPSVVRPRGRRRPRPTASTYRYENEADARSAAVAGRASREEGPRSVSAVPTTTAADPRVPVRPSIETSRPRDIGAGIFEASTMRPSSPGCRIREFDAAW